jgi:hypothetical protein
MHREHRLLIEGRTPFRCPNGHIGVDDAEPVQSSKGTVPIRRARGVADAENGAPTNEGS